MSLQGLHSETIGDLDAGSARVVINREIARAVDDLDDRGGQDGKARKVVIEVTMTNDNGIIAISVTAKATIPPYQTGRTQGSVREAKRGSGTGKLLLFREENPENIEQPTLGMERNEE